MKIKRFTGKNMQEVISDVKKELGRDAIILNTRNIKEGGFLGFFTRTRVEVIAAAKNEEERGSFRQILTNSDSTYSRPGHNRRNDQQSTISSRDDSELERRLRQERKKRLLDEPEPGTSKDKSTKPVKEEGSDPPEVVKPSEELVSSKLEEEIRLLRKMMENSLFQGKAGLLPDKLQEELSHLEGRDVPAKVTGQLAAKLLEVDLDWNDRELVREELKNQLLEILPATSPLQVQEGRNKVVALVGPTGVGKTTTLAKLAAGFAFEHQLDVGLITIDTYRIAAVEQLRTYADIMDLPLSVVFTPEEFLEALNDYADKDLVLVDTAGRSPKNKMQMQELKSFLCREEVDEIYLVLSLVSKASDMLQAAEAFNPLGVQKLILTKLDETNTVGPILELLTNEKYHISYVTTGQDVPEDIELLDPKKIINLLIAG